MSGTSTDDRADDKRAKTPSNTFSNTFSSSNSNSTKTLHGSSATVGGGGGGGVSMPKLTPSISSSSLVSKPTAILSGGKMNVDNSNSSSSIFSTPINNSNTTATLLTPSPINILQRPSTSGTVQSIIIIIIYPSIHLSSRRMIFITVSTHTHITVSIYFLSMTNHFVLHRVSPLSEATRQRLHSPSAFIITWVQ